MNPMALYTLGRKMLRQAMVGLTMIYAIKLLKMIF